MSGRWLFPSPLVVLPAWTSCVSLPFLLSRFCFLGFGARLLSEVKKLAPRDIKIRVSSDSPSFAWSLFDLWDV